MMYPPPPFSELGDIEVVADGEGRLHLFHLTLPNHDVVKHAVSDDGLRWSALPPALRTGNPGAADDDQIWTMGVARDDDRDRWLMLYTTLASADGGRVQRTGLATSRDLVRWDTSPANPVASADARWYETDPDTSGSVSWRDPKPLLMDGRWLATVAARENAGPLMRRGCVGLIGSDDGETWRALPPLFAPRRFWDLECPQAFPIGDRWHLTAAIMEDRRQRYWSAPAFRGPFETPPDGGFLAPAGHYAGRVTRWRDRDLLWCWHQPRLVEGWTTTPRTIDWTPIRNPFGKVLAPPLELSLRPDGSLARRSFVGWDAYVADAVPAVPERASRFHAIPADGWRCDAAGGRMDVLAGTEPAGDVRIGGVLRLDARHGGLAFRLDDEGGGYEIALRPGSPSVELRKWLPTTDPLDGGRRYRVDVLQREDLHRIVPASDPIPFALLVVGPYLEFSLFGEVVLATFSGERQNGAWGIWAESGTAAADDLALAVMRRP